MDYSTAIQVDAGSNCNKNTEHMRRSILFSSVAACLCFGIAAPLLAAEPSVPGAVNQPPSDARNVAATQPADKFLSDLRAFNS